MKAETLDEKLTEMKRFGQVSLFGSRDGTWNCSVDLTIPGQGTELKIKSDWKHRTPNEACDLCFERFSAAMRQFTQPSDAQKLVSLT